MIKGKVLALIAALAIAMPGLVVSNVANACGGHFFGGYYNNCCCCKDPCHYRYYNSGYFYNYYNCCGCYYGPCSFVDPCSCTHHCYKPCCKYKCKKVVYKVVRYYRTCAY